MRPVLLSYWIKVPGVTVAGHLNTLFCDGIANPGYFEAYLTTSKITICVYA